MSGGDSGGRSRTRDGDGVARRIALVGLVAMLAGGCAPGAGLPEPPAPVAATATPGATFEPVPTLTVAPTGGPPAAVVTLPPIEPGPAPTQRFAVDRREISVIRDGRPLRTVILHPAATYTGGRWEIPGTFPLVLFSHGLRGSPEIYEESLRTIAAAGFVVAAPEYPFTSADAAEYNPVDLVNQPADASAVITAVLGLNSAGADRLAGHLDPARVSAVGHSAGGYTTMGLLAGARDHRLRSAVVLAGASLGGSYVEPALPVLFVHGAADPVVPYDNGRAAYNQVPWPKAFLTVIDGGHSDFLYRNTPATRAVTATVLDFLRATLYGDSEALARIPTGAAIDTVTLFESTLDEPY